MVQFAPFFEGLARSISFKKSGTNLRQQEISGREAAEELAQEARRNNLMSSSQNVVSTSTASNNITSVSSMTGEKGVNQDRITLWKEFGFQKDMIFCGVFDGHGAWGHMVSKRVSKLLPTLLLWYWQETTLGLCSSQTTLGSSSSLLDLDTATETWRQSYLKACAAVDKDLEQSRRVNSFFSGTTASTVVKQGDVLIVANVGDSRAVLATTSTANGGNLTSVQLTVDFKPNIPEEAERILQSQGLVLCSDDEPGVYRVWKPSRGSPGLALSRAFGDHCLKDCGLISVPDVTARHITPRDQFVILATDGVWDVISNQEAVEIVSAAPTKEKSAKRLVKCAARAWRCKRPGIAMDDISAVCLYLHHDSPQAFGFAAKQSTQKEGSR